ncbi:sigma-54-dependent Fis family transcriptional regulator [Cereibacter azotoformans]|uniref:Nif-specific regulatory protein n=2 Tax=Cereibacter TaxID=1653176 RepID=A0A2T5KDK5_9RHOB|nr:sigma-54-dependent Fis family transcriptional regulator [Cereibacter azotoformans]AXQ93680.1 sigma-54-dependent Fis family transcriptional regulator [Cereibacter sphaeroides]MBO4168544.1 sigma-54-dependent Fis family transcriptional regulator [Cereibacter azotoformans]PTR20466.1 Fis family sigma54 specific transcriptional regulator [Cereibacter azotoformans]UIJ32022.1 sigma-54-dependent Fis family transcriptional regulator [Cereibacter azotoformans]
MTSHFSLDTIRSRPLPPPEGLVDRVIPGESVAIRRVKQLIGAVAISEAPVLVRGATGTGKELVAEALHRASGRGGNLVAVNCAAIPAELLESELFGHEKGAFTGAERQRIGRIEMAHGGTLFLDEIGDMPLALQAKLLRVLESRRISRVGGTGEIDVDFRLVTATHRNLDAQVAKGGFRSDLYYRINVFPLELPDLRERTSDIPLILARMLDDHLARNPAADLPHFDAGALRALGAHDWPGNVRELRNVLARALVLFPGRMVSARHVRENLLQLAMPEPEGQSELPPAALPAAQGLPEPGQFGGMLEGRTDLDLRGYLRDIEVALIEAALAQHDGCVSRAADALRLRRTTLIEKMKKFGIMRGVEA